MKEEKPKLPSHIAYTVEGSKGSEGHWQKIGAAWPAKNDGLTLQLNSIPLGGKIVLQNREALEKMRTKKQSQQQNSNMSPEQ